MKQILFALLSLLLSFLTHAAEDSFGYRSIKTGEPGATPFDVATITTPALPLTNFDDGKTDITLEAPFPFYGQSYTQIVMSTNGYLSFFPTDSGADSSNDSSLPASPSSGSGPRIYPLHDDLVADSTATLQYQYFPDGLRSFPLQPQIGAHVFRWTNVRFYGGPNTTERFTFSCYLFDDGTIYFVYPFTDNLDLGLSSTIGIQNDPSSDPFIGLLVASNSSGSIPNASTVTIYPPELTVTSNADAGPGTLRQAIADAPTPARISFDSAAFHSEANRTINLTSGEFIFSGKALAIDAQSVGGITLDAGGNSLHGAVQNSSYLQLNALNLTNGRNNETGSLNINNSRSTILNSAFYQNNADQSAGAIFVTNGSFLHLESSTLFDNAAGRTGNKTANRFVGGLAFNGAGNSGIIINCTIANNFAADRVGGLSSVGADLILENTVIANNSSPSEPDLLVLSGVFTSRGGNLIGNNSGTTSFFPAGNPNTNGDYVGSDSSPLNPLFVGYSGGDGPTLIDNGGPTLTLMPLPGSPLINKGNNDLSVLRSDQRGIIQSGIPDIGAVETTWNDNLASASTNPSLDVTQASDSVTVFPSDSSPVLNVAWGIDNTAERYFNLDQVNSGFEISPALGSTNLTGFSITSSSAAVRGFDPTTFVLAGSNSDDLFVPIASGELNFTSASQKQSYRFLFPPSAFTSYRIIFPEVVTPNQTPIPGVQVQEVELIGYLANTPQILSYEITPSPATDPPQTTITLTYTTRPDRIYGIQQSTPGLESFTNINGTSPSSNSFQTTTSTNFDTVPSSFFRIVELSP